MGAAAAHQQWSRAADCAGLPWCRCPGVVGFLGSFEDGQHICLVQEHCARGDLFKALLRQGGAMPEHRVCTEASFWCSLRLCPTRADRVSASTVAAVTADEA